MRLTAAGPNRFSQRLLSTGSPPPRLLAAFLLVVAGAYAIAYARAPSLPGASGPGWFAWFDQGEYLKSATAIAAGNFSPADHFYPPLYPLLGALFVGWLPRHPFLPVDIASLLVAAFAFVAAGSRFVWWPIAALVFLLTVVADHAIFNQYVYPWTSTPVAAIFSLLVLLLVRKTSNTPHAFESFVFGTLYGLLIPLRPVDAVAFAPLLLAWCWGVARREPTSMRTAAGTARQVLFLGLGFLPAIVLFFGFNLLVFRSWMGGYLHTSMYAFGFSCERLLEKAVSMLVDSGSIYLVPCAALLAHYPWLLLTAVGAARALARGPLVLRAIAASLLTTATLYLSYDDFLPTGLWRDSNIHYFTWMFPWLGFLAVWPFFVSLRAGRSDHDNARRLALLCAGGFALAIAGSLVRFVLRPEAAFVRVAGSNVVEIGTAKNRPWLAADVLDLIGLRGDANGLYHGQHRLSADGMMYRSYRDFRILPAPWGARMIFLRSAPAGSIRLQLDPRATARPVVRSGIAWRITYGVGFPCWIDACGVETRPGG